METTTSLSDLLVLETTSMRETLRVIDHNARGIAFVVDAQGLLKGVVTDGDVRRAILQGMSLETAVSEFMTRNPVTVQTGAPTEKILSLMSERVRCIPVTDQAGHVSDYAAFAHAIRLPVATPAFPGNELRYLTECVLTNWISSQGRFVMEFEDSFAKFCGVKHGVAVSNGTAALHLALVVAGVDPGDEVIVPTLTFVATANAVRHAGAIPILVDSEPESWNLAPDDVERKITSKTKAIIPVHLYGHPANMDPILQIAKQHNLFVIEDAAEAHGAFYKGRRVGSVGTIGCFSFFGNKIITTGEGGILTTNDDHLAERAKLLRDHAMSRTRKYWHEHVGFNYRLTNLQASIGVAQLEQIDIFLAQRVDVASNYKRHLSKDSRIELPPHAPWAQPVTWFYTVLLDPDINRDGVIRTLKARGIDSRPVFYPLHRMPPYYSATSRFPVAESISQRGISLPTSTNLTAHDIRYISESLLGSL